MPERPTDIIVFSRNRHDYLFQCITYIVERTHTPHLIHLVDDASIDTDYLMELWCANIVDTLVLRHTHVGLRAQMNSAFWLTFSDPVVFTDDDVLCPDLTPDWLTQGLAAFNRHPELGVMALNHPSTNPTRGGKGARTILGKKDEVTYSKVVGGTFAFVRRKVLTGWNLPHERGQLVTGSTYPSTQRCRRAQELGLKVGYLTDVYCQHIGRISARDEKDVSDAIMDVTDPKTLRPPEEWAW